MDKVTNRTAGTRLKGLSWCTCGGVGLESRSLPILTPPQGLLGSPCNSPDFNKGSDRVGHMAFPLSFQFSLRSLNCKLWLPLQSMALITEVLTRCYTKHCHPLASWLRT